LWIASWYLDWLTSGKTKRLAPRTTGTRAEDYSGFRVTLSIPGKFSMVLWL
jgi:hypothetical protein